MTAASQLQIRRGNRLQLWLLILLFGLPPLTAWLFYFNPQWLPQGHTNHGRLIEPPRSLQSLSLSSAAGAPFDWSDLRDQWTLTVLAEGHCDKGCTERLIKVRQIRKALGAARQRIGRLLILLPDDDGRFDPPNLEGLEGTRVALAQDHNQAEVLERFAIDERSDPGESIFLLDPRVELMMRHDLSQLTSKQVLQDLDRLLKASQNWARGEQYGHQ